MSDTYPLGSWSLFYSSAIVASWPVSCCLSLSHSPWPANLKKKKIFPTLICLDSSITVPKQALRQRNNLLKRWSTLCYLCLWLLTHTEQAIKLKIHLFIFFYNNCHFPVLYQNHCWWLNYSFWTHQEQIFYVARYCYKALWEQHICWEHYWLKELVTTENPHFPVSLGSFFSNIFLWSLEIAMVENATNCSLSSSDISFSNSFFNRCLPQLYTIFFFGFADISVSSRHFKLGMYFKNRIR